LTAAQPPEVRAALSEAVADTFQEWLQQAFKLAGLRPPAYLKGKPDEEAEIEALAHTCGLVQLAGAAWWRLNREMEAAQELDFTELEGRAVRLLTRSEVTRERLRGQYKVVMVDESQDVNPLQYRLLTEMSPRQLMMVGDVQQSIYGFRQADVELFRRQAASVVTRRLSRNYRSTAGILSFVDHVFGAMWREEYVPMSVAEGPMDFDAVQVADYDGVELWYQAASDQIATAMYVRELLDEGVDTGDIAVLVRDGGGALKMHQGLEELGIPSRISGGSERFYTRLEVRDLSNALRAVADPYDDFALLACLHGPMAELSMDSIVLLGMPDSERTPVVEKLADFVPPLEADVPRLQAFLAWYQPLRRYADRLAAWEVLAELFAKSPFLPSLARRENPEQRLANARKLLTLATQEPELGPLEYAERIREIQDLRHKEGDAPAGEEDARVVTIMTVHKAKGLEFPVVVLPQTDKRLVSNSPEVIVEPRHGLVATKFGRGQCLMHKYLAENRKQRGVEEELRVLYVGLTRAKQRLCIVLYPDSSKDTVSKRLRKVLGDSPGGVRVRKSQSQAIEEI